jgi:molybdenum cofactor cytidylyltransferase
VPISDFRLDHQVGNRKLAIGNFLPFCYLPHMSRAPSLCAVILAAGESTRMGTDKALLPWPPLAAGQTPSGQTFLSAAIQALTAFNDMVIVVVGKNESNLAPVAYSAGASLVRNPAPERGQFSSLQVGLQEILAQGRDAAMITLVDRPPVRAATMEVLHAAFGTAIAIGKWAVVPEYGGKHGHPILVGREMIEVFLKAPPGSTARDVEHKHHTHIEYVAVDDPSIALNVDTPQDYGALQNLPVSH